MPSYKSLRPTSSHKTALANVIGGKGWIVFRHFRKASGTSIMHYLLDCMKQLSDSSEPPREGDGYPGGVFRCGELGLYHHEWGAFPAEDLPVEKPALLVTCLREPLARFFSEFNYSGPGYSIDYGEIKELELIGLWNNWLNPPVRSRLTGIVRGEYLDNFYIRTLASFDTKRCDRAAAGTVPYYRPRQAFQGGLFVNPEPLTREDLEYAKHVLCSFDIVLLSDNLSQPSVADAINARLGVEGCKFSVRRRNSRPNSYMPDVIRQKLLAANTLDVELFQFAEDLYRKRMNTAVCHQGDTDTFS